MLNFIIVIGILAIMFFIANKITGGLLKDLILIPIVLGIWGVAMICCTTVVLIPLGRKLFIIGRDILLNN